MNETIVDFTKGIKSINITKYKSSNLVNQDYDMARITICMKIKENHILYNALKYDYDDPKMVDCPFCGSDEIEKDNLNNVYYVMCKKCKNSTPDCISEKEAIILWNKQ